MDKQHVVATSPNVKDDRKVWVPPSFERLSLSDAMRTNTNAAANDGVAGCS